MKITNALCSLGLTLGLFLTGQGQARADALYTFESIATGTSTPFSDTENGITANFSSTPAGGFTITTSFWVSPILGHVLFDPGPSGSQSIPLDVTFSSSLTSVTLDFSTELASPFTLNTYSGGIGGTFIGTSTVTGAVPSGGSYPQGIISFSSVTPFDSIIFSASSSPYFAVDNIDVQPVPEPATLALGGLGGLSLLLFRRQRK
jgi:hypothetical protein